MERDQAVEGEGSASFSTSPHPGTVALLAVGGVLATAAVLRLAARWVNYSIGVGSLEYKWGFFSGLPLQIFVWLLCTAFLFTVNLLLRVRLQGKGVVLMSLGLLVTTFFAKPSGSEMDTSVCEGLKQRIRLGANEASLRKLFDDTAEKVPFGSSDEMLDVPLDTAEWLRRVFPEPHVSATFYSGSARCLVIRVGGPYFKYGVSVAKGPGELLQAPSKTVSMVVSSNIVAFAR